MVKSMCRRVRPFRAAVAAFLAFFVLGVTSPTYADGWGSDKGPDRTGAATGNATANGSGAANGNGLARGKTSDNGSAGWESNRRSSADLSKPQPLSNADQNSGGANGKCPGGQFCSTRDGSKSKNGNGVGKANGKPCAGCVGRADNKNPPGQALGDRNKGYECDRNNGIGKTNPAHTGCKKAVPPKPKPKPKPKPPVPPVEEKPEVTPPAEKPAAEKPAAPRPPAQVPAAQIPVRAPAPAAPAPAVLPPTGADTLDTVLGIGGTTLLLTGAVLLLRRRPSSSPGRHVS